MKGCIGLLTFVIASFAISACDTLVSPVPVTEPGTESTKEPVTTTEDSFATDLAQAPIPTVDHTLIEHSIRPSEADPRVTTRDEVHRIEVMGLQVLRPQLVVFLAGTTDNATTSLEMLRFIAHGSTRAIGLSYSNASEVLGLCSGVVDTACIGKSLTEMYDGVDHSSLIQVPDENSVETRLTKLLINLRQRFPTEGWGYYLDEVDKPRWNHIFISGHSLGGYMAARIGQLKKVQRSVGLASFGYSGDWIADPSITPYADQYVFAHTGDGAYPSYLVNWKRFGYPGSVTSIDTVAPTGLHQLVTSASTTGTDPHHTVTIFNGKSPKNTDGSFIYAPVWTYLFDLDAQN